MEMNVDTILYMCPYLCNLEIYSIVICVDCRCERSSTWSLGEGWISVFLLSDLHDILNRTAYKCKYVESIYVSLIHDPNISDI